MSASQFDPYPIKEHFKENAFYYVVASILVLAGMAIGVYVSLTQYRYAALLSPADRNLFSYITGNAAYTSIFYSRLISVLICVLILFVVTLTKYTSFIGCIFLSYQSALIVLTSAAVITEYGLSGVLNVILFILPINLANLFVLIMILVIGMQRAKIQSMYKLKFGESFKENKYFTWLLCLVAILFVICLFHSFVLPLFIKSFVVINF